MRAVIGRRHASAAFVSTFDGKYGMPAISTVKEKTWGVRYWRSACGHSRLPRHQAPPNTQAAVRRAAATPTTPEPQRSSTQTFMQISARAEAAGIKAPGRSQFYIARYAHDGRAAFDQLASIDDPVAMFYAGQLAMSCHLFGDSTYDNTVSRIQKSADTSAEVKAIQMKIADHERQRCIGMGTEQFGIGSVKDREAAKKGSTIGLGLAGAFTPPDERSEPIKRAQRTAQDLDPDSLREVAMFFASRGDVRPNAPAFAIADDVSLTRAEMRDAWILASCDMGAECGDTDPWFIGACIQSRHCDNERLEDVVLREAGDRASRILAGRDIILRDLATNTWPHGFWGDQATAKTASAASR